MTKKDGDNNIEETGPVIFSLDTSSDLTSMSLTRGNSVVANLGVEFDGKRSERLWAEAEFLLNEAGLDIKDVGLFSVCVGPGGFTGLRVGIAAVKGLASATARPLIGVTSLEAAAFAAGPATAVFVMLGAYKGEVYSQLFSFDEEGAPVAEDSPSVATVENALERVSRLDYVVFTGSGLADNIATLKRIGGGRLLLDEAQHGTGGGWTIKPSPKFLADHVARFSFLKYKRGEAGSPQSLRACYVRPSEAEVKLSRGLLGTKIRREAGRI